MCGRYANHVTQMQDWADLLADWPEAAEIGYNIAPIQVIPAFTAEGGKAMRWGMVPPWSKEPGSRYATFNARSETVADKPAFRGAWKQSQTCLIPALGYYEWRGEKGDKQPCFVRRADGGPLVMAGLWEHWQGGEQSLYSCTILTQASAGILDTLHHRMPVFADPEQGEQWINDGVVKFSDLLANQPVQGLEYFAVDKAVNRSTNEGEHLVEPVARNGG